ncbi:MAG: hypothetical protein HRU25_13335 [Psychrobium sp.]|nr:hypothetical protein [Psychrobium sp.]
MIVNKLRLLALICTLSFIANVAAYDVNERQASKLVQSKYKAQKLLKVEQINAGGTKVFKVKMLLKNGRLKTVYVNSKTSRITDKKP